jgi:hypothetical protein
LANELKDKLQKMRKELEQKEKRIIELTKINVDCNTHLNSEKSSNTIGPNNISIEAMKLVEYSDMNKVTKKLKDSI